MDFFQSQDVARKTTSWLVFLFLLAVVLIIGAIYLVVAFTFRYAPASQDLPAGETIPLALLWDPGLLGIVAIAVSGLIGGGSLYKVVSLAAGGQAVAELLGGRLVPSGTTDPAKRRLLNVVEEMAIAAGTPVPPVYVMEGEPGINAFAAGRTTSDAVITVTKGTLQHLSRDELQGVIGHEFSHILNGDMRLNLRLMGILFGILLIGLTGWMMLRSQIDGSFSLGAKKDDNKGPNIILILGLALFLIGYIGVFFGNLIKAAISRQREFLADASSVQFTRNPDGITGALKKIGSLSKGSRIRDSHAAEASHMFFGTALGGIMNLFGLLDTHPPLLVRIRRIDPSFDGDFAHVRLAPIDADQPVQVARKQPLAGPAHVPFDSRAVMAGIGRVGDPQLARAAALREAIPRSLAEQVRDPLGAQAVIYALLIDPGDDDAPVRRAQLGWLDANTRPAVVSETRRAVEQVRDLAAEARLPLASLAIPTLRQMSPRQYDTFLTNVRALADADQRTSLFEFALQRMLTRHLVTRHLAIPFGRPVPPKARDTAPSALVGPVATVLSALARVGQSEPSAIARAFGEGVRALGWPELQVGQSPGEMPGLRALDGALGALAKASPSRKRSILTACATCVGADGQVTISEGELLRAIADSMDCPMPPLLVPQPPLSGS